MFNDRKRGAIIMEELNSLRQRVQKLETANEYSYGSPTVMVTGSWGLYKTYPTITLKQAVSFLYDHLGVALKASPYQPSVVLEKVNHGKKS